MPLLQARWLFTKMIAVGVIVAWPSTVASIPAHWTREASLDARFVKQVLNASTNPAGTGGAATHVHAGSAHTHPVNSAHSDGTSGSNNDFFAQTTSGSNLANQVHSHGQTNTSTGFTSGATSAFNYDAISSNPPYFEVIFIKSDGTPVGIPNGAVAYYNAATLPTNWRACDGAGGAPDMRNRFMRGAAAAADGGSTGGTDDAHTHPSAATHTHAAVSHSHTVTLQSVGGGGTEQAGGTSVAALHNHDSSSVTSATASTSLNATAANTTATGDGQPPFSKLITIQNNTGGVSIPQGLIAMWLGTLATIPQGWKLCDGTAGTPNLLDKFIKGALTTSEIGNTGGAATHTHASGANHTHTETAHSHTVSGSTNGQSTGLNGISGTAFNSCNYNHSHTWGGVPSAASTVTSSSVAADANTDNKPVYTDVAFIQLV